MEDQILSLNYERASSLREASKKSSELFPWLTLLHSEQPKLYGVLPVLSAVGLNNVENMDMYLFVNL